VTVGVMFKDHPRLLFLIEDEIKCINEAFSQVSNESITEDVLKYTKNKCNIKRSKK
jgi:hypothetical protein